MEKVTAFAKASTWQGKSGERKTNLLTDGRPVRADLFVEIEPTK